MLSAWCGGGAGGAGGALIAVGKIEHRGSKKAGGYYANAKTSK